MDKIEIADIIFSACRNNNINVIDNYLRNGGDINIINFNKLSILMSMCNNIIEEEEFRTIKHLVETGNININYINTDNNENILYYLAKDQNFKMTFDITEVFKYLIERGCDINLINNNGENLLTRISKIIAMEDNTNIKIINLVKLLLNNKIYVNICDNNGLQPIHYAVYNNNKKLSDLLIANGANICGMSSDTKSARKYL